VERHVRRGGGSHAGRGRDLVIPIVDNAVLGAALAERVTPSGNAAKQFFLQVAEVLVESFSRRTDGGRFATYARPFAGPVAPSRPAGPDGCVPLEVANGRGAMLESLGKHYRAGASHHDRFNPRSTVGVWG